MSNPDLLSDPVSFWDKRHASLDPWRSGGDRGLTPAENFEFYAFRLGRIVELVRRHGPSERPLTILDAGCGRGHFTDALRRCGHHATGIDASATAVARAREAYGPWFEVATLEAHRPIVLFETIICVDVLFHILDDRAWEASLRAFGRYAAADALLLITDVFADERFQLGNYIVHRARAEYDRVLAAVDFHAVERIPYGFGSNQNQFVAYRRG